MLRVLYATSELFPLIKTGGLADVSYALPRALRRLGIDVRVLMPAYPSVLKKLALTSVYEHLPLFTWLEPVRILAGTLPDDETPVYVLDCPRLFQREGGPYHDVHGQEWQDNALRFAALAKAAAWFGHAAFPTFHPDLIHCHDWQTGLTPAFLHHSGNPFHARTLMTIHNIAFQGCFDPSYLGLLGLPPHSFQVNGLEYYGLLSFLKAGIYYADWVTTVSPTYAREIQTPEFGYGLYGLLQSRQGNLTGIINGIDTEEWNPALDPHIAHRYSLDTLGEKGYNTVALRHRLGLNADSPRKPLIGMVTRLTYQKGLDILLPIIPQIVHEGAQLAILGSGDEPIVSRLRQLGHLLQGEVSFTQGYQEELAHQIEAGADVFLMPSLFEPCGLNQMYSMQYGTIPIVRRTGGLNDTVVDTTPATLDSQEATGFCFNTGSSEALLLAIQRALLTFRDKATWRQLQKQGMCRDFSWRHSAQQYIALYQRILHA